MGVRTATQWLPENHPCARNSKDICCLNRFWSEYQVDPTMPNLANNPEICTDGISHMGDDSRSNNVLGNLTFPGSIVNSSLISDLPEGENATYNGGVTYTTVVTGANCFIHMTFPISYFSGGIGNGHHARVTQSSLGTFKYEFFVGVVFISLVQNSGDTIIKVVQQNIEFTKSDFMFFSVATTQKRTPVDSVDLFVHQGQEGKGGKLLQYIEMYIGYDKTKYPGGVELDLSTLKWSRGETYSIEDSDWNMPCGSSGYYGLSDTNNTEFAALNQFALIDCLPDTPNFCKCDQGRFWIPFRVSDASTDKGFINGPDFETNVFITMSARFIKYDNTSDSAEIFSTIDLDDFPVLEHCTASIMEFASISDIMKVTVGIGIEENTAATTILKTAGINEFATTPGGLPSYGAAAIDMQFSMGKYFSNNFGNGNKFQLDSMVVMNFLGATGTHYEVMRERIASGTAFDITRDTADESASYVMAFNHTEGMSCVQVMGTEKISTANFKCMWRIVVTDSVVNAGFEESVFYLDDFVPQQIDAFKEWTNNVYYGGKDRTPANNPTYPKGTDYLAQRCDGADLSLTEFDSNGNPVYVEGDTLSTYTIRPKGDYSCLFVDPGYRWISRMQGKTEMNAYDISDKTIVAGLLTIRGVGNRVTGRRLLVDDGSGMVLHDLEESAGSGGNEISGNEISGNEISGNEISGNEISGNEKKTRVRATEVKRRLHEAYADSRSRHPMLSRGNARTSSGMHTKLATLGNHALSRRLLASDEASTEAEHMRQLHNSSSNNVLEMTNSCVDPDINIAYMTGHANASWQMFTWTGTRSVSVSLAKFVENVNMVLTDHRMDLGVVMSTCQTTGFVTSKSMLYRNVESVEVQGILSKTDGFGALYASMFQCFLASAGWSDNLDDVVGSCKAELTSKHGSGLTNVHGVLHLGTCGVGTTRIPDLTCNKLYHSIVWTERIVAFDWYFALVSSPAMKFSIAVDDYRFENDDTPAVLYSIRTNIGIALGIDMDRVLVLEDTAVVPPVRRLLATTKVFRVWVYKEQEMTRAIVAWPPPDGDSNANLLALFTSSYSGIIVDALQPVLGSTTTGAAMTDAFTKWTVPANTLKDFMIDIDVDMRANVVYLDTAKMKTAVKQVLADELDFPQLDMRVLSATMKSLDTGMVDVRITIELRLTEADAKTMQITTKKTATATAIRSAVKANLQEMLQSVTAVTSSSYSYHASGVSRVPQVSVGVKAEGGMSIAAVVAIIAAGLFGVGLSGLAYYYHVTHPNNRQPSVDPAAKAAPLSAPDPPVVFQAGTATASFFQPYYGAHVLEPYTGQMFQPMANMHDTMYTRMVSR
ncbi:hypothetical protein T484DRAFT_1754194 [Baffinella frigidus]|nr:hypothetical protein T484DRAFT_1754194 [Cryptophyta sp. CCMP2293]